MVRQLDVVVAGGWSSETPRAGQQQAFSTAPLTRSWLKPKVCSSLLPALHGTYVSDDGGCFLNGLHTARILQLTMHLASRVTLQDKYSSDTRIGLAYFTRQMQRTWSAGLALPVAGISCALQICHELPRALPREGGKAKFPWQLPCIYLVDCHCSCSSTLLYCYILNI